MNSRIRKNVNTRQVVCGIALIALAAASACLMATSAGEVAARLVGKAVWYLPYVSLVLAVRCLRAA